MHKVSLLLRSTTYRLLLTWLSELKHVLDPVHLSGHDRPHCLKNTRVSIRKEIDDWAQSTTSPNVFLLLGGAGTGKSTISTTIAEEYRRNDSLGCHLFFIREKSNPAIALPTIAYKLAEYSLPVAEAIERHLRDVGELSSATLRSKFEFLLRKPLSEAAAKISSPVLIVLDAMDECGNHETRRSLLEVLRDGLPTLPPNFRFIISSRPENDIHAFTSLHPSKVKTFNLDFQEEESKHDIFTYIKHGLEELGSLETLRVPQDWP